MSLQLKIFKNILAKKKKIDIFKKSKTSFFHPSVSQTHQTVLSNKVLANTEVTFSSILPEEKLKRGTPIKKNIKLSNKKRYRISQTRLTRKKEILAFFPVGRVFSQPQQKLGTTLAHKLGFKNQSKLRNKWSWTHLFENILDKKKKITISTKLQHFGPKLSQKKNRSRVLTRSYTRWPMNVVNKSKINYTVFYLKKANNRPYPGKQILPIRYNNIWIKHVLAGLAWPEKEKNLNKANRRFIKVEFKYIRQKNSSKNYHMVTFIYKKAGRIRTKRRVPTVNFKYIPADFCFYLEGRKKKTKKTRKGKRKFWLHPGIKQYRWNRKILSTYQTHPEYFQLSQLFSEKRLWLQNQKFNDNFGENLLAECGNTKILKYWQDKKQVFYFPHTFFRFKIRKSFTPNNSRRKKQGIYLKQKKLKFLQQPAKIVRYQKQTIFLPIKSSQTTKKKKETAWKKKISFLKIGGVLPEKLGADVMKKTKPFFSQRFKNSLYQSRIGSNQSKPTQFVRSFSQLVLKFRERKKFFNLRTWRKIKILKKITTGRPKKISNKLGAVPGKTQKSVTENKKSFSIRKKPGIKLFKNAGKKKKWRRRRLVFRNWKFRFPRWKTYFRIFWRANKFNQKKHWILEDVFSYRLYRRPHQRYQKRYPKKTKKNQWLSRLEYVTKGHSLRQPHSRLVNQLMHFKMFSQFYGDFTVKQLAERIAHFRRIDTKIGQKKMLPFFWYESRVDVSVFRLHLAPSLKVARLLVLRGYIFVNGEQILNPEHRVSTWDVVAITPYFTLWSSFELYWLVRDQYKRYLYKKKKVRNRAVYPQPLARPFGFWTHIPNDLDVSTNDRVQIQEFERLFLWHPRGF